jgi:hypothetical protein
LPQYFFDIRDGQGTHRDDTGLELPNIETAMDEARRALADMNRDALAHGGDQVLEIIIRDHGEGPVRLALSITTEKLDGKDE